MSHRRPSTFTPICSPSTSVAALNGEEDAGSTLQTLEVQGTGPRTRFTFAADERVEPVADTMESTDTVYAQSAAGQVSTLADRYQFATDPSPSASRRGAPPTSISSSTGRQ